MERNKQLRQRAINKYTDIKDKTGSYIAEKNHKAHHYVACNIVVARTLKWVSKEFVTTRTGENKIPLKEFPNVKLPYSLGEEVKKEEANMKEAEENMKNKILSPFRKVRDFFKNKFKKEPKMLPEAAETSENNLIEMKEEEPTEVAAPSSQGLIADLQSKTSIPQQYQTQVEKTIADTKNLYER